MQVNLYNGAYLIHNTSISINNHTTSQDSKLIQLKTQQTTVSDRNHLTCAFHTSGHILRLSARLSPSLIISHPHIKFWVAIRPAQLTHLTISYFPCDHYWNYSPSSVPDFTHSEGYTPVSASLSHIYLTNHIFNSHHVFTSYFSTIHISIFISYSNHKFSIQTIL